MKLTQELLAAILDAVKKDYVWRAGDEHKITRDPVNDVALLLDHGRAVEKERDDAINASPEIFLKSFDADTATMEMKAEGFRVFAELAYLYGEALGMKNYIESKATIRGRAKDEGFVVTLQRENGKTPHQLRVEADAERDKALKQAESDRHSHMCLRTENGVLLERLEGADKRTDDLRAFIARLYAEGTLSEGQAAKATGLDRVALRALAQEGNPKPTPEQTAAALDKFAEGGHVWDGVNPRDLRAGVPLDNPERFTPDDEYFHPCPPDGVHIERMDDGVIWVRAGEAQFNFMRGTKGRVIWNVHAGNESEVVGVDGGTPL